MNTALTQSSKTKVDWKCNKGHYWKEFKAGKRTKNKSEKEGYKIWTKEIGEDGRHQFYGGKRQGAILWKENPQTLGGTGKGETWSFAFQNHSWRLPHNKKYTQLQLSKTIQAPLS